MGTRCIDRARGLYRQFSDGYSHRHWVCDLPRVSGAPDQAMIQAFANPYAPWIGPISLILFTFWARCLWPAAWATRSSFMASYALARENACTHNVAGQVQFQVRDAGDPALAGQYDLVTAFECVHDMSNPVAPLRMMRTDTLKRYAMEAGFSNVEILPIENFFFRFYRLSPWLQKTVVIDQ